MTDDLQQYVNQKIASGQFESAEQFIAETVRVYREIETEYEQFRSEVQERVAQADSSDAIPLDVEALKRELIDEYNEDGTPNDG